MLSRLTGILKGLQVYPEKMKENINKSYGLFYSQQVLLKLTEKGLSRDNAYRLVQQRAMQSWQSRTPFKDQLQKDRTIKKYISPEELDKLFDIKFYTKNVNYIFKRVFKGH
jgi:adenylosuccinate lyase